MTTWKEVSTVAWDWKEQPDWKDIAEKLSEVNGKAVITEINTGGDYYQIVIHPPDWIFDTEEWNEVLSLERNDIETPLTATFEDVKRALVEWKKQERQEEEKFEKRITSVASQIADYCASGGPFHSGALENEAHIRNIITQNNDLSKERLWNELRESYLSNEGWTMADAKVLARLLQIKKVVIEL